MFAVALPSEEHFEGFSQKLSEVQFVFRSGLFNEKLEFLYTVSVLVRMQNGTATLDTGSLLFFQNRIKHILTI